jgi:hypothetical protein
MSIIREPILIANLLKALFLALGAFGIVVSGEQQDAILGLIAAGIAVAVIMIPALTAERNAVTPVGDARLPVGTEVRAYNPATNETLYRTQV